MQLVELQRLTGLLDEHHTALFAVSYDSVETLQAFAERNGITYPLLADVGSKVIRELGLLDEDLEAHHAEFGGTVRDEQRGVCYPGVFVLDERGVVSQRRFQRNYRVRESGASLIEQALHISAPEAAPNMSLAHERVQIQAHLDSPTVWRYQRLNAVVDLTIASGYHVYATPVPDGYTSLSVDVIADRAAVGETDWPEAKPFRVEGLDDEFWVYEGRIRVSVPFEFIYQRGEEVGNRRVALRIGYQVCNATTCFVPEEATLEIEAHERPGVD